jgi:ABC-type Fe3+ transport system permease subunit
MTRLLANSLLVSGLATLLAVAFGLAAALCLGGLPGCWRNRLLAVAVMALALPPFLVTNCWLHYLGHSGVWHSWLPLNIVSLGGTIWVLSLLAWPITLLAVRGAWQRLEPAQLESDPAVTGGALLGGLLLPLARNALAQAGVLTFVLALNNFAVPAILQVRVFPAEVWVRFSASFDTMGALELSWPLVLCPLLLLLWFIRQEIPWPKAEGPASSALFRRQLGRGWFWSCGAVTVLLCLVSVGLPLLQLVCEKRTWLELPGALAAGRAAIGNSVWFAAVSATFVVGLGSFGFRISDFVRVSGFGFRISGSAGPQGHALSALLGWLLWLPLLVPGVVLGIACIALFNRSWTWLFYQSVGIVILAFVVRYLALGWNTAAYAMQGVDGDLTDAARLEGANRWQLFRYVHWPQIAPQLAAAWYVVFLLCLWDVESIIMVVPPGGETVALRVFNLLHYGHNAQVNALCLTLLALAVAPLALWRGGRIARGLWPGGGERMAPEHYRAAGFVHRLTTILPRGRGEGERNSRNAPGAQERICARNGATPLNARVRGCASLLVMLALTGCAPGPAGNESPLASRFFSCAQVIGARGVGLGQFNKPRSVAVDLQDNLYVVDMTGRVQKFSSNGLFLLSWQMPQTELGKPKGMCRDRQGNIVVVEPHYQRVNLFSPAGRLMAQWGRPGTNTGQFMLPRAVAVNSQNEILVSEYGPAERVQRFGLAGRETGLAAGQPAARSDTNRAPAPLFLGAIGQAGTKPGEFNRPEGLCVDARDRIYVADSCNHRIQVFSRDGRLLRTYGKAGAGRGQLSYPYDITVDAAGCQYVCEFGNSRIQVFDANDEPIEIIGGPGAAPGQFNNPWGIALDSAGNLYVADSQNHRVQKLVRRPGHS